MLLGDLGADVIKVEEPGRGDYVRWTPPMVGEFSAAHAVLNRNKRSVTLNLKHERGPSILKKLVATADILIESFRPGVMERLGCSYEELAADNPGLVYTAITGYGQDGPYRSRAGHDINYIATNSTLGTTGQAEGPPVLPSVQVADLSGAMMAVVGSLAALVRKARTGEGDFVDISMMDASLSWLALHLAPWYAGADPLERGEGVLNGGFPFYRVYRCSDGGYLSVGAIEPQFWSALCTAIGRPELIEQHYAAGDAQKAVHKALEETFASKSRDEWVGELSGGDTCVAAVNSFEEMAADPQVLAREMLVTQDVGGSELRQLGLALKLANAPGALRLPAPGLGEHNPDIYREVDIDDAELASLASAGAL